MNQVLTKDFLRENKEVVFKFINWFNDNGKAKSTNVPIYVNGKQEYTMLTMETLFDLSFTLQLGYYIEWLSSLGIYITSYYSSIDKALILKLEYTKDKDIRFHYHDLDEVNTSQFSHNPLEAYELLIAMFIYKCQYPF